jgi:aspartyl-tRNA(Asn)/glutamyl-tRNA(Gln) amidotransferase subunit A
MSVQAWLKAATTDVESRGLHALVPLLEGLAQSTTLLRAADFHVTAQGRSAAQGLGDSGAQGLGDSGAQELSDSGAQRLGGGLPTIDDLARQLRSGRTTSVEATEACLRAIEARDGELNAFILVMADEARQRAHDADAELAAGQDRGPLHGVPISLKDLFDVRGKATTAASNVRRHDIAPYDAPSVVQMRQAGAVIIGKTNLHEFAFGTTNEDSAFGPSRHPVDSTRSPGGSSGGSAVSVATGMAFASLGTDTGGSIRIPSSVCGLVGLKPTAGEISSDGVVPLSQTLDHVGPLARTVTDAWYLHQALMGRTMPRALAATPPAHVRIAIPRRYFCDLLQADVRAAFERTVSLLASAGARINEIDIPHADVIAAIYLQIVFSEAAAYHAATLESMPDAYSPPVRLRLEMARYVLAEDYLRAMTGRAALRREVDAALAWHDALVLPTLPIAAPVLGEPMADIDGTPYPVRNVMLRLTQLFNITGHPALSLPCGTTVDGLPVGLQLVGRRHETDALMRVALGVERALA